MKRALYVLGVVVLVFATEIGEASAQVALQQTANPNDPIALGQPLSHWLKVIRGRDPEEVEMAFEAIFELGPAAWKAVPELTHIVGEPFAPIRVGTDSRQEVLAKLVDVHLRAGAVDALGSIGTAAASAARPVIRWALTVRVLPPQVRTPDDAFYVELVGMDALERMRGAGAIAQFGVLAADAVQELVESRDAEKVKFAAAILNEGALPMAVDLMTSASCRDRQLGLTIFAGMWPVVAKDHFTALNDIVACDVEKSEPTDVSSIRSGLKKSDPRLR